jgi:hypothetical protein
MNRGCQSKNNRTKVMVVRSPSLPKSNPAGLTDVLSIVFIREIDGR